MRDLIKDEAHFKKYILEEQKLAAIFTNKLMRNEVNPERIIDVERELDNIKYKIFVARYNLGENLAVLRNDFLELIDTMPKFWDNLSSYLDIVWMMSIAVMYEVEKNKFKILSDLVDKCNRHDALLDFFTTYMLHDKIELGDAKFTFSNPYGKFEKIILEDDNRELLLKEYVTKHWYKAHNRIYEWNKHLTSRVDLYNGFWSYESGAVAKILNIDDSQLKNTLYYPYDLAHYHR